MHLLDCVTVLRPVLAHSMALVLLLLPSHAPAVTALPLFLSLQHMASCLTQCQHLQLLLLPG